MIKINLQSRKSAVAAAAAESGGGGGLNGLLDRIRNSSAASMEDRDRQSVVMLALVYFVILGGAWWFIGEQKAKLLGELDAELATLESKSNLLTSELNKTNGFEQMKLALESDEKTIRTKIDTIQELIRDRSAPPKVLITLSESIPKDVWLKEFTLKERRFTIAGRSNSMDMVSDFMKSLEETIYFKGVTLKSSRQETPPGGRPTASFELEAERR